MSLLKQYQRLINENLLQQDQAQQNSLNTLNKLLLALVKQQKLDPVAIKGVYLWGKVGRGKTMMMDMFYKHLTIKKKQRIHFHHFMEAVHKRLNELSGKDEPLARIASEWSKKVNVLCFDEFFVNDIADAMLLAGLFKTLFSNGVTLVATSNCQPEQLYRNGLLRERFLPTIDLLNQYCDVISVNGEQDHRLSNLIVYTCYYYPAEQYQQTLIQQFQQLSRQQEIQAGEITINHRNIHYFAKSGTIIWFDFFALCSGPRSQRDYMQIAKRFTTVIIANVPQFSGKLIPAVFSGIEDSYQRSGVLLGDLRQLDDEARRFIALVDEFYEQKIQLIVSAEVDIFALYQAEQLAFEFARCESRLIEMQSAQYADEHKKTIN